MDNTVRLWDAVKAFEDLETDDFTTATGHINLPENSQDLLLGTYMTKSTPVVHLHFTRRNLLLAAGAYSSQWIWKLQDWLCQVTAFMTSGCEIRRNVLYRWIPLGIKLCKLMQAAFLSSAISYLSTLWKCWRLTRHHDCKRRNCSWCFW